MSALLGTGALALWLDVAAELDEETDEWYVREHLPERVDVGGYLRSRRYQAEEGGPGYFSLFEARDPQALASDGYLALVRRISEQSQRIRGGFSNVLRNTFEVRSSGGRGVGGAMATLRLAWRGPGAADGAALRDWMSGLLRLPGIVGVHWLQAAPEVRAQMDAVRAVGQQDGAVDHALLIEATRAAPLRALRQDRLSARALSELGWHEQGYGVYRLMYAV